jgi:integrase/recombinase XerD
LKQNKHEVVQDFLQKKQSLGRSTTTLENYSQTFHRFFHDYFPQLSPEEVEVEHVEEFLRLLENDYEPRSGNTGLTAKSKKTYLNRLSSLYSWALKRPAYPEINSNPAAVVAEEIRVKSKSRPDCATWSNAKRIVQELDDPRNKAVAAVMAKTGARVSETCNIQTQDLLLEQNSIRLRNRKGGGETIVPIDPELKQFIEKYRLLRQYPNKDPLFVSNEGNQLSPARVRTVIKEAAIQADVMEKDARSFREKFTPHTFRTVFTTLMRDNGMSDHVLKYIRDDSAEDMLDVYTRISQDKVQQEYLDCIENLELNI